MLRGNRGIEGAFTFSVGQRHTSKTLAEQPDVTVFIYCKWMEPGEAKPSGTRSHAN
jgi:hypothetical protein